MKKTFLIVYHNIIRNLKSPLLLLISISFSMVIMLTAFVSVGAFVTYREQLNSNIESDYDLSVFDVKYENYNNLEIDEKIDETVVIRNLGYINLNDNNINIKKYIYLQEMTEQTLKNEGFILTEGRLPETQMEIIVPSEYARLYSKNIGDPVLYELGWLKENNTYLHERNSRLETRSTVEKYEFEKNEEVIYTIVGIYENSNSLYVNNSDITHYYAYSRLNAATLKNDDLVDVLFKFKETSNLDSYAKIYSSKLGATSVDEDYSNVWKFKATNLFSKEYKLMLYTITIFLAVSIAYLSIKSALEYGNTDTKKFYTRLMSLGATSNDIKNAWDLQTIIISFLAIPLGVCLSILLMYLFVSLPLNVSNIDVIINSLLSGKMILISIAILLLVILFANHNSEESTLYLIPLESIKGDTESISAKYVRYNNITKLRGEIDKYVKNNFALKRKTFSQSFVFMFALSISFVMMFLTLNIFTTKPILDYLEEKPTHLTLTIQGDKDYLIELKDISKIPEVVNYSIQRNIKYTAYTKRESSFKAIGDIFRETHQGMIKMPINFISVSDEEFAQYFKSITSNGDIETEAKKFNFIISSSFITEKYKSITTTEVSNIKAIGGDFQLYYTDLNGTEFELDKLNKLIVLDINKSNVSLKSGYQNILVKDSYLDSLLDEENYIPHKIINVEVTNRTTFMDKVNGYLEGKEDLIINVQDRYVEDITDSLYIDIAYLSAFIIVIVGIILLFMILYESVGTYTKSRTKELGLLKSIGVNSKKLESIIQKEYSRTFIVSLLLGTILGASLNMIMSSLFSIENVEYINSTIIEVISFAILLVIVSIFFLISVNINTRDLKRKYPIELMKDNFREF